MKAVVSRTYGSPDVLSLEEVETPTPGPGEVRVKVHAATVGRTDACALRAHPFFMRLGTGLFRPKRTILGLDFAGVVDAVAAGVTKFAPGDKVFGLTPGGCGAHAEYVCVSEDSQIAAMPAGKAFHEVVVCEGAWYADTYLKKFGLGPDHNILVYGASGAIGTSAVQLAKFYGATVTAVVGTRHLDLARGLGADRVVDYTAQDFTQIGDAFDFVLDAVGKTTYFWCRPLLKPDGVFAATDLGPGGQNIFLALWCSLIGSRRIVMPMPESDQALVEFMKDRLEDGAFNAVIDRRYRLRDIADAYRYVDTEQKTGIVVIDVAADDG